MILNGFVKFAVKISSYSIRILQSCRLLWKDVVTVEMTKEMPISVNVVMSEIVSEMKRIFGDHLRQVILFGSYARGEQEPYSDLDVMVLVNLTDAELGIYNDDIAAVMTDISLKYGVIPSIIDKNQEHFNCWAPFLPFYRAVQTEGIEYYAN